jgi:orotate phosphoribosyltransferase
MSGSRDLATKVYQACHLTGQFILRSGREATEYFDKYAVLADPELLDSIAKAMCKLVPRDIEIIAGLEMGAIPLATMLSHYCGLPAAFVRKQAKRYGTARLIEGASISGRKVLVVEDVVTTGGQVIDSALRLRELGASISHVLVLIDRNEGAAEVLRSEGIHLLALFKREDFGI